MSSKKSSTGLGVKVFTAPTGDDTQTSDASPISRKSNPALAVRTPEAKSEKVRTTVTLYPRTLSALEQLKVELRKSGTKVTLSDVLDEAVWSLMEKKGLRS